MPRTPKKQKQTVAEKTVEEFFPVKPEDLRRAVEKPVKNLDVSALTTVEKIGKAVKPKTKRKRKTAKTKSPARKNAKKSQFISYEPAKVNLKQNGYELIVTEKPQAALKIASALGDSVKRDLHGVPYYEVNRNGKEIVVACAVGHLFTLAQTSRNMAGGPAFDIKWVPNFIAKKGDFSKKYYDALVKLVKDAGSLTVATDYDIEGEVIGWNVIRFIGNQKDASRMKFSTLTDKELNDSYEHKFPTIDWGQAIAGETRHYLDWFYGINLSRFLMAALKAAGKFKIMSIGRVQGPALNMIVEKENQILAFKPMPYWQIFIELETETKEGKIGLIHNKDIFKKAELEKFHGLKGKTANVSTEKKSQELQPNPPFNLTTLQTEAYRLFNLSPSRTLQLAQNLYLAGLISYPRTSSQKLPPSIAYREILEKLAAEYNARKLITRKTPIEGKKSDPAHPSIYPTGNKGIMNEDEKKLYDLIVKRFISLFCDNATVENKIITASVKADDNEKSANDKNDVDSSIKNSSRGRVRGVDSLIFVKRGSSIKNPGWLQIYPVKVNEEDVPDINGQAKILESKVIEKETQPPRRFSQAAIISELEKRNLGTKATRANILETLYDRGYVEGQSIKATPLGISLIETLKKHSPIIIDEKLTRNFENEMNQIQEAKKGQLEKEEKVIEEAKETIGKISSQFKSQEAMIGKDLAGANEKLRIQQREENKLNVCPVCQKGNLAITYSPKTRRYFVACNRYPECKTTFSLPPNSLIKKTDKICEKCSWPMLMSLRKGKRPWFFCFNPKCETNKERIEEYRKKKQAEENNNS